MNLKTFMTDTDHELFGEAMAEAMALGKTEREATAMALEYVMDLRMCEADPVLCETYSVDRPYDRPFGPITGHRWPR